MAQEMEELSPRAVDAVNANTREYVVVGASGTDPASYAAFRDCLRVHWVDHDSTRSFANHSMKTFATGLGSLFAFIKSEPSVIAFRIDADLCRKYTRAIGVYMECLQALQDKWADQLPESSTRQQLRIQGFGAPNSFMDRMVDETDGERRAMDGSSERDEEDDHEKALMRDHGKSLVTDALAAFLCRLTSAVTFGGADLLRSMINLAQMGRIAPNFVRIPAKVADLGIASESASVFPFHVYLPDVHTMRLHIRTSLGSGFVRSFANVSRLVLDFRATQTSNFGLPPYLRTLVLGNAHYAHAFNANWEMDTGLVDALSNVTCLGLKHADEYYGDATGAISAEECKARSAGWAFLSPIVMRGLLQVTIDIDTDPTGVYSKRLVDLLLRVGSIPTVRTLYLSHSLGRERAVDLGGGAGLDWAEVGFALAGHETGLLCAYNNVVIDVSARFCIGNTDPGHAWPLALSKIFPVARNIFALRTGPEKEKDSEERAQILSLDGITDADVRLDALAIDSLAKLLNRKHERVPVPCIFECVEAVDPPHSGDMLRQLEVTEDPVTYAESARAVEQLLGKREDIIAMGEMADALAGVRVESARLPSFTATRVSQLD